VAHLAKRRLALVLVVGTCFLSTLQAQSDSGRARIALYEPAGQKRDTTLTAVLSTVADSVELSLVVLQRYEVRRLAAADPVRDMARVRAYCDKNHIDQAILGSGSARKGGGYDFRLVIYDRQKDSITVDRTGSSTGALDMFDVTDALVASLLDGLSGTHLLFGSLMVETDPSGAIVTLDGKTVGAAPVTLHGLPVGTVKVSASSEGREDAGATATIADGETTRTSLTLARSVGTLSLKMPADGVVSIRSTEIGNKEVTGAGAAELPTGNYDVEASCPGLPGVTAKVTVNRGANTSWLPWPKGYLEVQAVPAGATIMVDGVERGVSPLVVEVEPGTLLHRVELRKDKYEVYRTDVSAAVGDKTSVAPALVPLPGSIRVETSLVGADVQLEDQRGKTPYLFENVQPGQHLVQVFDLRVGNRMYTVGDPVQVEVSPGETAVVSRTFVEGKGHLTITDAPSGSIVTIDGKSVDSEKALTTGLDVPAGWMDVVVQGPDSQKWTGTIFVAIGSISRRSVNNKLSLVLPRRTIKIDGSFNDWNGIVPAFTSGTLSPKDVNLAIDKVYLAVDEKNLYMRFDIKDVTKSSFFHQNNFMTSHRSSYGLDLESGMNHVVVKLYYNIGGSRTGWQVQVIKLVNGPIVQIDMTSGKYAMKGPTLEASFPLEPIKKNLGTPSGPYIAFARTHYDDDRGQAVAGTGDVTEEKLFTF
jgi:hypothetical protein